MKTKLLLIIGIFVLSAQLLGCGKREISFSANVQPIFQENCIDCHDGAGEGIVASGFSVHDYASVMKGTTSGAVFCAITRTSVLEILLPGMTTAPKVVPFMTLA